MTLTNVCCFANSIRRTCAVSDIITSSCKNNERWNWVFLDLYRFEIFKTSDYAWRFSIHYVVFVCLLVCFNFDRFLNWYYYKPLLSQFCPCQPMSHSQNPLRHFPCIEQFEQEPTNKRNIWRHFNHSSKEIAPSHPILFLNLGDRYQHDFCCMFHYRHLQKNFTRKHASNVNLIH